MKSLRDIQRAQAPLVHRLGCGDTSVLHALFTERVAEWPHRLQHDELVTVGLFDDIGSLAPDTAFRTIPSAVELAAKSIETSHFECALVLLLTLARASDTTESPTALRDAWADLASRSTRTTNAHQTLYDTRCPSMSCVGDRAIEHDLLLRLPRSRSYTPRVHSVSQSGGRTRGFRGGVCCPIS